MNDINQNRLCEYVGAFRPTILLGCKNDAKARIGIAKIKSGLNFRIIRKILDYLVRNKKKNMEILQLVLAVVKKNSCDLGAPSLNKIMYELIKSK